MVRVVLGVIVGYLVAAIVSMIGIVVVWSILGASGAFKTGTVEASTPWSIGVLAGGFVAAIVGGLVAAVVGGARAGTAVKALAGLILILGFAMAALQLAAPKPEPPDKDSATFTFMEAGQYARSPNWYNFSLPVIGAIGVLIGGGLRKGKAADAT